MTRQPAQLFVVGGEALGQRKTRFVDAVGDAVDTGGEYVVHDDGESGSTDTQGRIVEGLGDTFRQVVGCAGTTATTFAEGAEGADHPDNRTEQTDQGGYGSDRGQEHQVLFQHGQLEGGSLFDFLLDGDDLLFGIQLAVGDHFLVFAETGLHDVGDGALLLVAFLQGGVHILIGQVVLNLAYKVGDITLSESL